MDPLEYYRKLRSVKRYVETHIGEPISLNEVAQLVDLSKAHFSRLFHSQTGTCFQDWLVRQRVEYAKDLMRTENQKVTQVAFAVGFGSISAFGRAFKKLEGMTPRAFLTTQREAITGLRKQTPINGQ